MQNQEPSPYFAAIDLGSNSFHLLIAQINNGIIDKVDRVKEMVQIAQGLGDNKELSAEAQERALHCLECFNERIRDIPPSQIRVAGTKALRSARNASSFLRKAEAALGHTIDIISGYEEARLVYLGVSQDLSPDKGRSLVIDIGGGSTEFIIGENQTTYIMESLSIGCVTYSDNYFTKVNHSAPATITTEMIWKTYYATCIELEAITRNYQSVGWDIAIGSSGTMKAIAQLMQDDLVTGVITKAGLSILLNQLHTDGGLIDIADLTPQRRNVLPAGIIILSAIMDQLQLDEIHVVESALKEGLILDTLARLPSHQNPLTEDIRDLTVDNMMKQYQVDEGQASRVDHALSTFAEALPEPFVNGINVKKILHWAAQLHEIGLSISHTGFHHHGRYLIQESDMAGFSRFEQELLALIVGSHRRKIRSEQLTILTADHQHMLYPLLVCLRIATILNHRREDGVELPNILFCFDDNNDDEKENDVDKENLSTLSISLHFSVDWLNQHPLTSHRLSQEQQYLAPLGVNLSYH